MNAFVLLLCVICADDGFSWRVTESPAFEWKITEAVAAQDARGPGLPGTPPAAPGSSTTVCRCQGHKEHLCLCLKARQKCHCTRTSGSVWAVNEQGRATHKTGAKADPRIPEKSNNTEQPASLITENAQKVEQGYAVSTVDGFPHWVDSSGRHWNTHDPLTENTIYGGRFVYRGGRMQDYIAPMAVQIPTGRWVKRCYGSYCRMEWVPN